MCATDSAQVYRINIKLIVSYQCFLLSTSTFLALPFFLNLYNRYNLWNGTQIEDVKNIYWKKKLSLTTKPVSYEMAYTDKDRA